MKVTIVLEGKAVREIFGEVQDQVEQVAGETGLKDTVHALRLLNQKIRLTILVNLVNF